MNSLQLETLKRCVFEIPKDEQKKLLLQLIENLDTDIVVSKPIQENYGLFRSMLLEELSTSTITTDGYSSSTSMNLAKFEIYKIVAERTVGYYEKKSLNYIYFSAFNVNITNRVLKLYLWNLQLRRISMDQKFIVRFLGNGEQGIKISIPVILEYVENNQTEKLYLILAIFGYKDETPELTRKVKEYLGVEGNTIEEIVNAKNWAAGNFGLDVIFFHTIKLFV